MDYRNIVSFLVLLLNLISEVSSAQIRCPRLTLVNGRVVTRNRGHMATFICDEGFHRVGARFSVCLSTGLWTQKAPMCVGIGCRPVRGIPNLEIEPQYSGAVLKFSCKAGFYRDGPEQAYCDGSEWSSEAPTCVEGVNLGCDFETESMCGWNQDQTDDFDWTWHKGHTPTSDTGPSVDHTTNSTNGHYLYMESSAPTKRFHKARLVSPVYKASDLTDHCLQFFYHMLGPDEIGEMGHLEVFIHPSSIPTNQLQPSNLIFSAKTNMGDKWNKADMEIPPQTQPVMIIFEGTRMRSWNSDIALDDVKIYNCPEGPDSLADMIESSTNKRPTTTTTTTTKPSKATTITTSPSPSTTMPDAGQETSSTGNDTTVDSGKDHSTSTSGLEVNETTSTSLPDNTTSENTTMVTDKSSDGTTSVEGGENSTILTFRPSQEEGGSQGETTSTGAGTKGKNPGVRQVMNQPPRTAATASTSSEILPIVIGILAALVVVAILVAVVVWAVARRNQKRDAQLEDELKIISKSTESK